MKTSDTTRHPVRTLALVLLALLCACSEYDSRGGLNQLCNRDSTCDFAVLTCQPKEVILPLGIVVGNPEMKQTDYYCLPKK